MTDNGFIPYWNQIRDDKTNYTYSIDNVVLRGDFYSEHGMNELLYYLRYELSLHFSYFRSGKMGAYSHQFKFCLPDKNGFFIGVGMNTVKGVKLALGIDFNPNKVMHFPDFINVYNRCLFYCKPVIKRFDLAIDIPVLRSHFHVNRNRPQLLGSKDNVWSRTFKSLENYSEYWGRRSHVGLVKLYNKQIERRLNYPMTRLELTLDMDFEKLEFFLPEIHYLDDLPLTMDWAERVISHKYDSEGRLIPRKHVSAITSYDFILLIYGFLKPNELRLLCRNKYAKISYVLERYFCKLELNMDIVRDMYAQVEQYCYPLDLNEYSAVPFCFDVFSEQNEFECELYAFLEQNGSEFDFEALSEQNGLEFDFEALSEQNGLEFDFEAEE